MSIWQDPFIIKNLTFGIEDSVVSTTGVLVGIAAASFDRRQILIAGFILILVEALSMAYGTFISDENFLKTAHDKYSTKQIMEYAVTMFVSYFGIGLVLLSPYALALPHATGWVIGIAVVILTCLITYFERNIKKAAGVTFVGVALMMISILIGGYLKNT